MTVADNYVPIVYTGNGLTTSFPFSWAVQDEDEVVVISRVIATGEDTIVPSANYTVVGTFPGAGSVTYAPGGSPLAATHKLILTRDTPKEQSMDINSGGGFIPNVLEQQLDAIVMKVQELADDVRRAPVVAPGEDPIDLSDITDAVTTTTANAAAAAASAIAAGTAEDNAEAFANIALGVTPQFATIALAELYSPIAGPDFMRTLGFSAAGDKGGAVYKKVGAEPTHEAKFSITLSGGGTNWYELAEPVVRVEMLGMFPDDAGLAAANATAFDNALAVMKAQEKPLRLQSGVTYHTNDVHSIESDFCDIGADGGAEAILKTSATSGVVLATYPANGTTPVLTTTLNTNERIGSKGIGLASTVGIEEGDIIRLISNKAWYNDPRTTDGFTDADANNALAQAGGASTITLHAGHTTPAATVIGSSITIRSGTGAGQARLVTAFDEGTKVATVSQPWETVPDNTSLYQFPQATKGMTNRVRRLIDANTIEIDVPLDDGYHVVDTVGEGKAKEIVSVEIYRPYTPRIMGVRFEGPGGEIDLHGASLFAAVRARVDISFRGVTESGLRASVCFGGDFEIDAEGVNDVETGYGCQISHCHLVWIRGKGFENRRLFDVSGTTPCGKTRIHSTMFIGGGLREDDEAWKPIGTHTNSGVGSHGPGRDTIYEGNYFASCGYGIYERGYGCTIRNNTFGARIDWPILLSHGGPAEIYGNVCDPRCYENYNKDFSAQETEQFGEADESVAYAEGFVIVGANFRQNSRIVVRDNIVRVKNGIVLFQHTLGTTITFPDISVYDNDAEYYPVNTSDAVGVFNKTTDSGASGVRIGDGGRLGPNHQRVAEGNTQALLCAGANVSLTASVGDKHNFGHGRWSIRLGDDTSGWVPVPQSDRDRLYVALATDAVAASTYMVGFMGRNSTNLAAASKSASVEATATAGTGTTGTDARVNLHFDVGKLTIENRLGSTQVFDLQIGGFA